MLITKGEYGELRLLQTPYGEVQNLKVTQYRIRNHIAQKVMVHKEQSVALIFFK
jgi:hypothetical protein